MKRHLSRVLQRKRDDFESTARPALAPPRDGMPAGLNGYDWLARIKGARVVRVRSR